METSAVILQRPRELSVDTVRLGPVGLGDAVVEISHSGISTGTEKLLWSGEMPPFPGMGYPLVPGYEAIGNVVEAGSACALTPGDRVFVPGANCFGEIRGLFGAASAHVVTPGERLVKLDPATGPEGALLALAATAHHALALHTLPDLIVGHGTLGRLLARLAVIGGATPTVWEKDPARRAGADGYEVCDPEADSRRDYRCIYDASGDTDLLDTLIGRLAKGGEIVLAGFYAQRVNFAFPMAFMKEARLRVAAEWTPDDMTATAALLESGRLRLDDLITHRAPASAAASAYQTAFTDTACLKMILDWKGSA